MLLRGKGEDDDASRKSSGSRRSLKDDKSITSARSNVSNKSARSSRSVVLSTANEPAVETSEDGMVDKSKYR